MSDNNNDLRKSFNCMLQAWANAVARVMNERAMRNEMKQNSGKYVCKMLSMKKMNLIK